MLGSPPNLLHQRDNLPCQNRFGLPRKVAILQAIVVCVLYHLVVKRYQYGYEYGRQEMMTSLIVTNHIGLLQQSTHLIFAVYK